MPNVKYDPAGAIRTVEELQTLIAAANAGEPVKLYEVNGVSPSVHTICLLKTATLVEHEFGNGRVSLKCCPSGELSKGYDEFFLTDHNIGQSYNNNYMFSDIEQAKACRDFMLTDPEHIRAREAWIAECREWDNEMDDYWDSYDD